MTSSALTSGQWYHVALVRSGSRVRAFLDGTQVDSDYTSTTDFQITNLTIGTFGDQRNTGSNFHYTGHLDEIGVSKGEARWQINFIPPTSAYSTQTSSGGYIGIGVSSPGAPVHHSSGAQLSIGGSWVNASDRKLKDNFLDIDLMDTLGKIAALPVQLWNYKAEGAGIRHLGPVAQDFFAAFGLGGSETSISTVDASGVALAGVKAIAAALKQLGIEIVEGIARFTSLVVGSPEKPSGITLFDKDTGEPYCIEVKKGEIIHTAGACASSAFVTSTTTSSVSAPGTPQSQEAAEIERGVQLLPETETATATSTKTATERASEPQSEAASTTPSATTETAEANTPDAAMEALESPAAPLLPPVATASENAPADNTESGAASEPALIEPQKKNEAAPEAAMEPQTLLRLQPRFPAAELNMRLAA